jgi:hypothetical protein
MLTAFVVFLVCYVAGSITLVSGLAMGNQRLQHWGMGSLLVLTLGVLGMAVTHDLSPPYRGYSGSMLK